MNQNVVTMFDEASPPDVKRQRAAILDLEKMLLTKDQLELEPQHLIHGGMYARALTVPADTILTGQIYKFDHIEIMTSGKLLVTTDKGESRILEGFNMMPAMSGKKRAAYAIEETTWVTFHAIGDAYSDDPEDIQDMITAETFEDLDKFYIDVARADYEHFLQQMGWSHDDMAAMVETDSDLDFSYNLDHYGISLYDSDIAGKGLFADKKFEEGSVIMPARVNGNRTQAGRYMNHSPRANCAMVMNGDDLKAVAARPINEGDELTVNYRDVLSMRAAGGDL